MSTMYKLDCEHDRDSGGRTVMTTSGLGFKNGDCQSVKYRNHCFRFPLWSNVCFTAVQLVLISVVYSLYTNYCSGGGKSGVHKELSIPWIHIHRQTWNMPSQCTEHHCGVCQPVFHWWRLWKGGSQVLPHPLWGSHLSTSHTRNQSYVIIWLRIFYYVCIYSNVNRNPISQLEAIYTNSLSASI